MHYLQPIYTEKAQCQDCYKCIRHCPVKAIRVESHRAMVMPERCVWCGVCVSVCPVGAKRVRNDLERARHLLRHKKKVLVSLAPSFVTEFQGIDPARLVDALRTLGFWGVSETALGADEVSAHVLKLCQEGQRKLLLSTACPSAVELICKYYPHLAPFLTQVASPVLAHCALLRARYGDDIGVVFISPCISKKLEADNHPELLDVAITFKELRQWLEKSKVSLDGELPPADVIEIEKNEKSEKSETEENRFLLEQSDHGALYPMDGGMVQSIRSSGEPEGHHHEFMSMSLSGLSAIRDGLQELDLVHTPNREGASGLQRNLFIELLACDGGCINGPQSGRTVGATVCKRLEVQRYAVIPHESAPVGGQRLVGPCQKEGDNPCEPPDLHLLFNPEPVHEKTVAEREIRDALKSIGKRHPQDELNCGGCGYESCRGFAIALVCGNAETAMCVSHMRRLAMNKANAIFRTMPSGVVIVDEALKIIECNAKFARILGGDVQRVHDAHPGMAGVNLAKMVPEFVEPFQAILEAGAGSNHHEGKVQSRLEALGEMASGGWEQEEDSHEDDGGLTLVRQLKVDTRIVTLTVFCIEPGHMVGGLIQDITQPAVQREQIVAKTKEVIRKNLTTVQQIAYLLGENAAESEVLLSSIIDSFNGEKSPEGD